MSKTWADLQRSRNADVSNRISIAGPIGQTGVRGERKLNEECDTKSMWEICHNKRSPCLWFNKSKESKLFLIEYSAIKNVKYKQSDKHLWSTTGSLSELTESTLTAFINTLSALIIRIYLDICIWIYNLKGFEKFCLKFASWIIQMDIIFWVSTWSLV